MHTPRERHKGRLAPHCFTGGIVTLARHTPGMPAPCPTAWFTFYVRLDRLIWEERSPAHTAEALPRRK